VELVSATQITLFRECERKWAWRYIAKLRTSQHPAAALGTEVENEQLQPYLKNGTTFDYSRDSGNIAASGLAFLPKPDPDHALQTHFAIPSPTWADGQHVGFGIQGYVDLWKPQGGMPALDVSELEDGTPAIVDFKTTGNWKYAKTKETLKTDVQAQLYATAAMYETGARKIDLIWIYFGTKGPRKAKRIHLRVHAPEVAEQFEKINATALEMHAARKSVINPLELMPNTDSCEAFGGCPYRSNCNLSPGEIVDAKAAQHRARTETTSMSNATQTMGLKERLAAQRAATLGTAPPPSAVTKPVNPYELSAKALDGQAAADAGVRAVTSAGIPVENLPAWATAPVDPLTGSSRVVVGINPPESALPPAPPVGSVAAPPPPAASAAPITSEVPGAPKRGPGRPKKATGAEAAAALVSAIEGGTVTNITNVAGPGENVTVTWAEETISPIPYNVVKVGPFAATGAIRPGESVAQASARIYDELESFAEGVRATKLIAFKEVLEKIGGSR
jgi:hypothetical protein